MEKLNHFILWCKGWYEPINSTMDIFDEAVIALKLDDYVLCSRNNVINIVTNYIDELIDRNVFNGRPHYLKLQVWNQNVFHNMHLYNVSYEEAILLTLRHFFRFHIDKNTIKLNPPTYSRKLYKMGFVAPRLYGNSYKMQNHKVKNYFNRISEQG